MRILFISNWYKLFSNLNSGAANRSTMFIKALTSMAEVDVIDFSGGEESNIERCNVVYSQSMPLALKTEPNDGRWRKFMRLFDTRHPENVYPLSQEKMEIVDNYMRSGCYDYVACRYFNEAIECGLFRYANQLIIDIDDNPANMYKMLRNNFQGMSWKNYIYHQLYVHTIRIMVKNMLNKTFCVFHSNPTESPSHKSIYLHNVAVQKENIALVKNNEVPKIIMVGSCNYGPNADGVKHFVDEIFPKILLAIPNAQFYLVGRVNNDEIEEYLSQKKHVFMTGYVEDIAEVYRVSNVVVIPIYSGCGTCVKTIEAMKMNRPFVSTPVGMRGLDDKMEPNVDYMLALNDADFAEKVIALIQNVSKSNHMAKNAYQKYLNYWSMDRFTEIVKESILIAPSR